MPSWRSQRGRWLARSLARLAFICASRSTAHFTITFCVTLHFQEQPTSEHRAAAFDYLVSQSEQLPEQLRRSVTCLLTCVVCCLRLCDLCVGSNQHACQERWFAAYDAAEYLGGVRLVGGALATYGLVSRLIPYFRCSHFSI